MCETRNYTDPNLAIIKRCQKGERLAFQELYNLYAKAMFNISLRIVNNSEEAEEVLQDAFVKAFNKISTYDPKFSFGMWLKRMVINASLDVLRKRKVILVSLEEMYIEQEAEDDDDDQDNDKYIYDVETIKKCITQLPDGYRTILSLYLFEDHTHQEVADMLGINIGTSKSQYRKAKLKLIELLKHNTITHERSA